MKATLFVAAALIPSTPAGAQDDAPKDFQRVLPRGNIASIDDPQYVSADEADLRDDAWVLGVLIDEQPRAYSLDLLNAHEVVNDTIGDVNFAAVW